MLALTLAAGVVWAVGCDKKETEVKTDAKNAATDVGDAVKSAAESIKVTSEKVAQDVKETSQKVAKDVAAKAEELAVPVNRKAQEIIDATRKLVSDGKVQAAFAKWTELAGEKLSAEQKAISDGLRVQIDRLLATTSQSATNTSNTVGNLIK
jgi:hypothetical protein